MKVNKKTEHQSLKDRLFSKDNIFKAIYSLDSYVFERGLLCEKDIELLYQLRDSHNCALINTVITHCQKKIRSLLDNNQELFNIEVFFKFKSKEGDTIKYRPLHSAALLDLICMVAMLRPLIFEEPENKISLSELCKLIPHNFYGNLPSVREESLFIPWQLQYKHYSEDVLQHYKKLVETKEYTQEVCLDLKDFFPSVSPYWVYQYALDKLELRWPDDIDCLKRVLCKLLFFKIQNEDMSSWKEIYYSSQMLIDSKKPYYNRGLAQGLPQSYFFGNLAMVEIAKISASHFSGDSYYYVDDSVIYTNGLNNEIFKEKIEQVNRELHNKFDKPISELDPANVLLGKEMFLFQKRLQSSYNVRLHTEDKTFYSEIMESDGTHGGILPLMAKEISIAGSLFDNMDGYDDNMSLSKIEALLGVIDYYIGKYEKQINKINKQGQLKMLKRYRRFFLFRKKLCLLRNGDDSVKSLAENIERMLKDEPQRNALLDNFDQEAFIPEVLLLLKNSIGQVGEKLVDAITRFEKDLVSDANRSHLYFHTIFSSVKVVQQYQNGYTAYDSLSYMMRPIGLETKKVEVLREIFTDDNIVEKIYPQLPDYARGVCSGSDEFRRRILNAYLSGLLGVELNDTFNLHKKNNFRSLQYFDLRLLAFVRNKSFKTDDFRIFVLSLIKDERQLGATGIDANLLSVVEWFVLKVRNPRHVDCLICTHKLVSGLWMNGSKFMHQYTLHNQDHAIALIRLSLKLIKHIDYLGLKQNDFFILFLACYLHDVSMVINPQLKMFNKTPSESDAILTQCLTELHQISINGKEQDASIWKDMMLTIFSKVYDYFEDAKRAVHADESAWFVMSHADSFFSYIEPSILQMVADVGASHCYDTIEVYGRRSNARNELFSVKYMMILIRLADVMDITSERVNYFLLKENFPHFSNLSKFHWISHYITDHVNISSEYEKVEFDNSMKVNERIKIVMDLNTNNLIPFAQRKCKGCNLEIEGKDKKLIYRIEDKKTDCTYSSSHPESKCPLLCVWIRKKHEYLFRELMELSKYINRVNLPLFISKIEIEAKLARRDRLDPEFFDAAFDYLQRECDKENN